MGIQEFPRCRATAREASPRPSRNGRSSDPEERSTSMSRWLWWMPAVRELRSEWLHPGERDQALKEAV
jgi:hypothetical protein